MTKTEQIESINREQLVTATDRLLLGGRPRRFPRGSMPSIENMMAQSQLVTRRESTVIVKAPRTSRVSVLLPCFVSFCLVVVGVVAGYSLPM